MYWFCRHCGQYHQRPGHVGFKPLSPADKLSTGGAKTVFDPSKLPSSGPKASFDTSKISSALDRWGSQQAAPNTPPQTLPSQTLPAPAQPYQPTKPTPDPSQPTYEPPAQAAPDPSYQAPAEPSYGAQPSTESPAATFDPSEAEAEQQPSAQQPAFEQPAFEASQTRFAVDPAQSGQPAGPVYVQKESNLARDVAVSVGSIVIGSLIVYALTRSKG